MKKTTKKEKRNFVAKLVGRVGLVLILLGVYILSTAVVCKDVAPHAITTIDVIIGVLSVTFGGYLTVDSITHQE